MAFSFGSSNGSRGGRRSRSAGGAMSEINIVPLVDVVLVLLIIFMLTAHVMEFGMEVNVPEVKQVKDSAEDLPVVSITRDGKLFLNEKPVNIHQLPDEVAKRFKKGESRLCARGPGHYIRFRGAGDEHAERGQTGHPCGHETRGQLQPRALDPER